MQARRSAPTEETESALPMQKADERLLIMKVPKFLMQHLQNASAKGQSLGTVQAVPGSGSSSAASSATLPHTLTLPETGLDVGMPREYEFRFSAPPPATYIFSSMADGSPVGHEGRAMFRGEIRPKELTAEYRALLKNRAEKAQASAKGRQINIVRPEDERALKHDDIDRRKAQQEERAGRNKKQEQRQLNAKKRAQPQLTTQELKDELLKLFFRKPSWSRNDIIAEIGHSDMLGKCLDELCDKITQRGGACYGDYKLKDAFRTGLSADNTLPVP